MEPPVLTAAVIMMTVEAIPLFMIFIQLFIPCVTCFCLYLLDKLDEKSNIRSLSCCRVFSMWRYLLFYLWLCCLVIGEATNWHDTRSKHLVRYASISFIAFSLVVVLIESGSSRELDYLKNISRDKMALEYIQEQQLLPPKIELNVECYHYDRSSEQEVRVDSFVDTEELLYGSWVDVSQGDPLLGCTTAITRISIHPDFLFGDREIAGDFRKMKAAMIERNCFRDEYNEFVLKLKIPGIKTTFCGHLDEQVKPFWMRPLFYWIATFLWMTWPYRWLFRAKTDKVHYTLKKKIYKNATPPNKKSQLHASIADERKKWPHY